MKLIDKESQCQKKCCGYFSHPLDDMIGASPEAYRPEDIIVKTRANNCTEALYLLKGKEWEVTFRKAQLQMQLFCMFS